VAPATAIVQAGCVQAGMGTGPILFCRAVQHRPPVALARNPRGEAQRDELPGDAELGAAAVRVAASRAKVCRSNSARRRTP
jgi:hypothetical protein